MNNPLKRYKTDLEKCVRCGKCQATCPTYIASTDESNVARGRMSIIKALVDDKIKISKAFQKKMSTCTSCMNCTANCPTDVKPFEIINMARYACHLANGNDPVSYLISIIISKGWAIEYFFKSLKLANKYLYSPFSQYKTLSRALPFIRNNTGRSIPSSSSPAVRSLFPEIIKPEKKTKLRVLFFLGCMTDLVFRKPGISIIEFLVKNNIEVIIPPDLYCCGAPLYYMGDRKSALKIAENNIRIINSYNADIVINNCATCGSMLTGGYASLLKSNKIIPPVIDIHKFLIENKYILEYDSIKNRKPLKVTYHDPCHLKRGQGVFTEPRELLKSIPWIEFVEMNDADQCCGGAGIFSIKHYDLALEIAKEKIKNIKDTGAEVVVTGCPSCRLHLTDALKRAGMNIDVIQTVELIS